MGTPRLRILRVVICSKARMRAQEQVRLAVQAGQIPDLKKEVVKCTDCDKRARSYDHRLYAAPLVVEPVCIGHNTARGFAIDQTFKDAITGEPRTVEDYRTERCKRVRLPVDRIISAFSGSPDYLKTGAEKADWHNSRMRGRRHEARDRRNEYLSAEHEYYLRCGTADTRHRKSMTGSEALRLNLAADRDFIAAIQNDNSRRLYRWCLVDNPFVRGGGRGNRPRLSMLCSHKRFASK